MIGYRNHADLSICLKKKRQAIDAKVKMRYNFVKISMPYPFLLWGAGAKSPVYDFPAAIGFGRELTKVKTIVRFCVRAPEAFAKG